MKHLLSIESLDTLAFAKIFALAHDLKKNRRERVHPLPLDGQTWAMIFSKSSTRTRVSFEVGIHELGGNGIFLNANDIQLGRGETVEDTAQVLGRYVHGIVIRTYEQKDIETLARVAGVPVINALTDDEHPCQILSDLFTIREKRGTLDGLKVAFFGDGDCNVARSWLFAAAKLGFELRIAAPSAFQPQPVLLKRALRVALKGKLAVKLETDPLKAADGADVLYTDVWVSMGKEAESKQRLKTLTPYQLNAKTLARATKGALVMHCLPAYRGKEISADVFDGNAATIFDQAENRLHVQKAVICLVAPRVN